MGNIFTESGQWYKGNLHAHTIHSDGKLTPEQSVQAYRQHGYSFMCLSEHDHFTDWRQQLDSEDFILLPGLEASTCLVDTSQMDIDAQDLTDYLKSRGCFTTYNHPIWSRVDTEDVRDLQGAWAIEVYNYATVNECGEGEDTTFWDARYRSV